MRAPHATRTALFLFLISTSPACSDDTGGDATPTDAGADTAGADAADDGPAEEQQDLGAPALCASVDNGVVCDVDPADPHVCIDEACVASRCGDTVVDDRLDEVCDDGNDTSGDGCEPTTCAFSCTSAEQCDDGDICSGEEACGPDHTCVAGTPLAERSPCVLANGRDAGCFDGVCEAVPVGGCGDGTVNLGQELCDDGNLIDGDGCDADCTRSCKPEGFARDRVDSTVSEPFTMVLASDPQMPWGNDPTCEGDEDDCKIAWARKSNRWFTTLMNDLPAMGSWPADVPNSGGRAVTAPEGVIMNGDLTAYWHPWQVDLYREFYDAAFPDADDDVLEGLIFPGFGNHDYANNVESCWGNDPVDWGEFGSNSCAAQAVRYMRAAVSCDSEVNFDASRVLNFDLGSMAYSFDVGGWHFVQLHNYPGYTIPALGVTASNEWLRADLLDATEEGMPIVLNVHDHGRTIRASEFQEAIAETNVVVVFAGHLHSISRFQAYVPGTRIPTFLSGSADTARLLIVEFGDGYFTVGSVDTTEGAPTWRDPDTDPADDWQAPDRAEGMVSVSIASVLCGNGVLNSGEGCDEGDDNGSETCSLECVVP